MTPKEKADDLVAKFRNAIYEDMYAKDCAIIAVNEVLEATAEEKQVQYDNGEWSRTIQIIYSEYYLEVKEELEKM